MARSLLLPLLHAPQGFLFRFADDKVGPSSKPRGIVDLSTGATAATKGRLQCLFSWSAVGRRGAACIALVCIELPLALSMAQ